VQEQQRKDYEAEIKAYQAETQRISAVQAGMTEQQIQDIANGCSCSSYGAKRYSPELRQQPEMPMEGMQ